MVLYELFNLVKSILMIVFLFAVFIVLYLYFNQNKMIYVPNVPPCTNIIKENPIGYRDPSERNLDHREITIISKDKTKLYGWLILHDKTSPTILYLHENAGNIGTRLPYLEFLRNKIKTNILLIGYRGYGHSEGTPSEQGIMLDAEAIIEYVVQDNLSQYVDKSNIYVLGRSLGGAAAIHAIDKLKPDIKGLILENTFLSMGHMVDHLFPFVKNIKGWLLTNIWPSNEKIKNLTCPILFVSSGKDELVPFRHMKELFNLASQAKYKSMYVIEHGTHNESWQKDHVKYKSQMMMFIEKCENCEFEEEEYTEEESGKLIN